MNNASIDDFKSKSSELEKYLAILNDREEKQNDREKFLIFLYKNNIFNFYRNELVEVFPHLKESISNDKNELLRIKGCELDRYDEKKQEYENKYKTNIKKYEEFIKLKEIHKLLPEMDNIKYSYTYSQYLERYNTDISDQLLAEINELYEEMTRKIKHYNDFNILIDKLYHIRYTTIKNDILKAKSKQLYEDVLLNQNNLKDNEVIFNKVKEIVGLYDILSSIRNIKYLFY